MRREEFMKQLEALLADISEEEREEALSYYRSYFEDAGEENEERILRELESPKKVAATIKADLKMEQGTESGVFTEHGFEDRRFQEEKQEIGVKQAAAENCREEFTGTYKDGYTGNYREEPAGNYRESGAGHDEDRVIKIGLIVVIAVLTSPIWSSILLGVFGTIFGVVVGFVAGAGALYVCGGVLLGIGIGQIATGSVAVGFGLLGAAMFIWVIAILMTIFSVWICGKGIPWICNAVRGLWRKVFPGKEQAR